MDHVSVSEPITEAGMEADDWPGPNYMSAQGRGLLDHPLSSRDWRWRSPKKLWGMGAMGDGDASILAPCSGAEPGWGPVNMFMLSQLGHLSL